MKLNLAEPRAKLDRAYEHMVALYDEAARLADSTSASHAGVEHYFDGVSHVISTKPFLNERPLRMSTICGDFVHNLRSALDHLVWQLVIATDRSPGTHNFFPICLTKKAFKAKVRPSGGREGCLEGIAKEYRTLIEEAQPYNSEYGVTFAPLSFLHELDIADKHRAVINVSFWLEQERVEDMLEWNAPASTFVEHFHNGPLLDEANTEILRIRFSPPDPGVKVKDSLTVESMFRVTVAKKDVQEIGLPFDNVATLYYEVLEIIEGFADLDLDTRN